MRNVGGCVRNGAYSRQSHDLGGIGGAKGPENQSLRFTYWNLSHLFPANAAGDAARTGAKRLFVLASTWLVGLVPWAARDVFAFHHFSTVRTTPPLG